MNVELVKARARITSSITRKQDFRQNSQTYDVIFDTVGKCSFGLQESLTATGRYLAGAGGLREFGYMLRTSLFRR